MKQLLLAVCAVLACVPDPGPAMSPGENCMTCHTALGEAPAYQWSVAGTVFQQRNPSNGLEDARVLITDSSGASFFLRSNLAGNFYTRESIHFPLTGACVEHDGATSCDPNPGRIAGSCNQCHLREAYVITSSVVPPITAP